MEKKHSKIHYVSNGRVVTNLDGITFHQSIPKSLDRKSLLTYAMTAAVAVA